MGSVMPEVEREESISTSSPKLLTSKGYSASL
jgi:hypothetical protein